MFRVAIVSLVVVCLVGVCPTAADATATPDRTVGKPIIGVPVVPNVPVVWCSDYGSGKSTISDLEIVSATWPSGPVVPGEPFDVSVVVRNNSTVCVADPGWSVHLESTELELGSVVVNTRINRSASIEVTVSGVVPMDLSQAIQTLQVHARVQANNFADGDAANSQSQAENLQLLRRPQLVPMRFFQQDRAELPGSGFVWDYKIAFTNVGSTATCEGSYVVEMWRQPKNTSPGYYEVHIGWEEYYNDYHYVVPAVGVGGERDFIIKHGVVNPNCIYTDRYDYFVAVFQFPWAVGDECRDQGLDLTGPTGAAYHVYPIDVPTYLPGSLIWEYCN